MVARTCNQPVKLRPQGTQRPVAFLRLVTNFVTIADKLCHIPASLLLASFGKSVKLLLYLKIKNLQKSVDMARGLY